MGDANDGHGQVNRDKLRDSEAAAQESAFWSALNLLRGSPAAKERVIHVHY